MQRTWGFLKSRVHNGVWWNPTSYTEWKEKLSYHWNEYSLGSAMKNHCHSTQSTAPLTNGTWNEYAGRKPHVSFVQEVLCTRFHLDGKTVDICSVVRCLHILATFGDHSEAYIWILEKHILPSRQCLFLESLWLFQQDTARPHTASMCVFLCVCVHAYALGWSASSLIQYMKKKMHFRKLNFSGKGFLNILT